MKTRKSLIITPLFLLLSILSFSQDTIRKHRLKNGNNCIFYKKGSNIPFTGVGKQKLFFSGETVFITFENGIMNGKIERYYRNGIKKFEVPVKYGDKNGEEIGYYKNGTVKTRMFYENGIRMGLETQYYITGKLKCESEIKNDLLNGKSIWYYPSGEKQSEEIYENGILISAIFYDEDGSIYSTENYVNGKRVK